MQFEEYIASLKEDQPPKSISHLLQGLWYDARGDWDQSHRIIQDIPSKEAAWVHAYLHRKEGDIWNADYWYAQAGRKRPDISLEDEWMEIVKALIC